MTLRRRVREMGALADAYRARALFSEAEAILQRALPAAERAFGPEHVEISFLLNKLGLLYTDIGRFADAGRAYQRALSIAERASGSSRSDVAAIYQNLGGLEHASGNFARGEPFARRAVAIRRQTLGSNHPDLASALASLAALLDGQKKYGEAERLYLRALSTFERVHGPEHVEIALTLNNLAALHHARARHPEAARTYERALAIKEKLHGADHPDVAMTLNNLAVCYKAQRQYARAEPLFERALSIFEKALGPNHPKVAVCLENSAELLRRMRRHADAAALDARARRVRSALETLSDGDVGVTATINTQFASFPLDVRRSAIHRWGVFAGEAIPPHRKVIEYTGERISRREARRRAARSMEYLFILDAYWKLDGAVGGSGAEFINHSCDPNLYSRLVKGHILYFSRRSIEVGEELTVDYRFSPSAPRVACQCGSAKCRGTINLKKGGSPAFRAADRT